MRNLTKDEEVTFTKDWWSRTLKVEMKLINWLRKLHGTEIGGYEDYQRFKQLYKPEERTERIFTNIANDELKHGEVIVALLGSRGFVLGEGAPKSTYWHEMDSHITDLSSAAAVNYFGEALAAFRFEIMYEHKETPEDIKNMLDIILPDEQFHRETLKRLAGDEILSKFREKHNEAVAKLKGG
jgi:hypothetical protein